MIDYTPSRCLSATDPQLYAYVDIYQNMGAYREDVAHASSEIAGVFDVSGQYKSWAAKVKVPQFEDYLDLAWAPEDFMPHILALYANLKLGLKKCDEIEQDLIELDYTTDYMDPPRPLPEDDALEGNKAYGLRELALIRESFEGLKADIEYTYATPYLGEMNE